MKHVLRNETEPEPVVEWWLEKERDVVTLRCKQKGETGVGFRVLHLGTSGIERVSGMAGNNCGLPVEQGVVRLAEPPPSFSGCSARWAVLDK